MAIDKLAAKINGSRSEAVRQLIEAGLTRRPKALVRGLVTPDREGRQAMIEWANYDADGKRVPPDSERAAFRAKEVSVDTGVPAPPGHASLAGVEYRDVQRHRSA